MTQRGPVSRSHGAGARVFALAAVLAAILAAGTTAWGRVPATVAHPHAAKLRHGAAGRESAIPKAAGRAGRAVRRPVESESRLQRRLVRRETSRGPSLTRASLDKTVARPEQRSKHRAAAKTPAPPRPLPEGAELTADDFFRAAGAAPETMGSEASTAVASVPAQPAPRTDVLTRPTHEETAEEAVEPVVLPGLYRNGRLVVPAPLKGSHEILVHQNLIADDEGLDRIRDNDELNRLRAQHQLVNLPESAGLRVNPELGADRRCARLWTVKFVTDMARAFYGRFHEPLQVNSAVRTVAYQMRLQRTNGNAAGTGGETASPHLTGQAVDIGKRGMTVMEIAWMRAYLKPMMDAGKLDVEEEFQQACFHISVYKSYLPARRGVYVAQVKRPTAEGEVGR